MARLQIRGTTIVWPQVCACCLEEATHSVENDKEKSTFVGIATIRRRLAIKVPYCEPCHRHVLWNAIPLGIVGLLVVGCVVSLGAAVVGALAGGILSELFSARGGLITAICLVCALVAAVLSWTLLYPGRRLRNRPRAPLGAGHFRQAPVELADFGKDDVTLEVHNPAYANLLARMNPGVAS